MKQEFIPYEQAVELKQFGFDEPCFGWYQDNTLRLDINSNQSIKFHEHLGRFKECFLAPLYQQSFRWFREKHRLFHNVERESAQEYFCNYSIKEFDGIKNIDHRGKGYRYEEEAELACLVKLIEIVKTNKL